MSQGEERKSVVKQLEYCGFKYDLVDKPSRDKMQIIQNCADSSTDIIKNNMVMLLTTDRMALCSEPDNMTAIDKVPAGEKLLVTRIALRNNSSSIYYARVKSANGKYCGWVSLASPNYELFIKGVSIIHNTPKESDLYEKWVAPITWRADGVCEYRLSNGGTVTYDGTATGITYEF